MTRRDIISEKRINNIIRQETGMVLKEINLNSSGVLNVISDDECMDIMRQLNMIAGKNNIRRN